MTALSDDRPRQRARTDTVSFVVQVHAEGGARVDSFRGRAEHLASGREVRFTTAAGLLEFLHRLVADQGPAAPSTTSHGDSPDRDEPH